MKEISKYILQIQRAGMFRNDGRGNIWRLDPSNQTWRRIPRNSERREIAEALRQIDAALRASVPELRQVAEEIREQPDFCETALASIAPSDLVVARNGIIRLADLKVRPLEAKAFQRVGLDFTFDPEAVLKPDSAWHRFLETSLGVAPLDKDGHIHAKVRLLLQTLVYATSSLHGAKKAIILLGKANTGKSVLLHFIGRLVGEWNYEPLSLHDMGHRFRGSLLENARLVLSHEIGTQSLRRLEVLKAVIAGDPIVVEQKGQQPKKIIPRTKVIVAANALPMLREVDHGNAFADRLAVLTFDGSVEHRDPGMLEALYQERDMILSLAVKEAPAFIKAGLVFEKDPGGERAVETYRREGNALVAFLNETYDEAPQSIVSSLELYDRYADYCHASLLRVESQIAVRQQLVQLGFALCKKRVGGHANPISVVQGLAYKTKKPKEF